MTSFSLPFIYAFIVRSKGGGSESARVVQNHNHIHYSQGRSRERRRDYAGGNPRTDKHADDETCQRTPHVLFRFEPPRQRKEEQRRVE